MLFGVDFEGIEEFVDQKNRIGNIRKLLQGKDSFLGLTDAPAAKRRKSLDCSQSSNMDVSMKSIPEECQDNESRLMIENEELRIQLGEANSKIKQLETELRASKEEIQIFKKQKYTGYNGRGGGCISEYRQEVRVAAISVLAEGETSVGITRAWEALATFVPQLLGDGGAVPNRKTLDRIRDDISHFNALQRDQFVQQAEFIVISVDGTNIGTKNYSVLGTGIKSCRSPVFALYGFVFFHPCLGIWDHQCNYLVLAIDEYVGKTGEQIADIMYKQFLRLNITNKKPVAIMSDKCPAQHKANRLFGIKIGKKLQQLICGEHSSASLEGKIAASLPLASEANQSSKQLFGGRQSGPTVSYSATSLKSELDLILRLEKDIHHSSFKTDLGSRYAVILANSQQLLLHKDVVLKVLKRQSKSDSRAPSVRLYNLMTSQWNELQLELGAMIYFWHCIIGPYQAQMAKYNKVGAVKVISQTMVDRMQAVAASRVAFDTLRQCNFEMSNNNAGIYMIIDSAWSCASITLKRKIHDTVQAAANKALKKAKADNQIVQAVQADNDLVFPSENRRAEAVFSALKHIARKYDALMAEKQSDVAIAKCNHLARWIHDQDDQELLNMMREARANRKAVWSDRSARKRLFDRELYDRLFLAD